MQVGLASIDLEFQLRHPRPIGGYYEGIPARIDHEQPSSIGGNAKPQAVAVGTGDRGN